MSVRSVPRTRRCAFTVSRQSLDWLDGTRSASIGAQNHMIIYALVAAAVRNRRHCRRHRVAASRHRSRGTGPAPCWTARRHARRGITRRMVGLYVRAPRYVISADRASATRKAEHRVSRASRARRDRTDDAATRPSARRAPASRPASPRQACGQDEAGDPIPARYRRSGRLPAEAWHPGTAARARGTGRRPAPGAGGPAREVPQARQRSARAESTWRSSARSSPSWPGQVIDADGAFGEIRREWR